MPKVTAIVQARLASHRLPGKVLLPVAGWLGAPRSLLGVLLLRLKMAKTISQIRLAVPKDGYETLFWAWLRAHVDDGVLVAGEEDDVLARYWRAAADLADEDYIVRITADCPLVCPEVVDRVVTAAMRTNVSYARTDPTYPEGLDVEVFTKAALAQAHEHATGPEREHVTLWMRRHLGPDVTYYFDLLEDCGALRLTVDYFEDVAVVQNVIAHLGTRCTLADLLADWKAHPERFAANAHIPRNEWAVGLEGAV